MKNINDPELEEYKKIIGKEEFKKQYKKLYQEGKRIKRFSGKNYENSPEKLNQIKEKYKNGVTQEILKNIFK